MQTNRTEKPIAERPINFTDFNCICRFCLERNGSLKPIFKDEFPGSGDTKNDPETTVHLIKSSLGLEIVADDGLPLLICGECLDQLIQCYNFRQQCFQTDELLREIRAKHEELQYFDNFFEEGTDQPNDDFSDQEVKINLNESLKVELGAENDKKTTDGQDNLNCTKLQKKLHRKRGRPRKELAEKISSAKPKNRPEMCEICGTMQTNIKIHLLIHDSVKAIECAYCGKKFAQKYSLHSHFKIHINERPHQCPLCPYKFHQAAHLRRHMCTHTGEKRFKCDMCPRQFAQSGTLNEHRLAHTQNRQVPCPYCDKMFLTKKALRSHVGIHTGERPFKCEVCGLSYVSSSSLSAHRRIHKRENPTIQCELCQKVFDSRTMWRSHVRDHGLNTLKTHLKVFVQ